MFKLWLSGSGVKPSVRVGAAFLLLISLVQLAKADCCTGKNGEVSFNLAKGCGVTVTSSPTVNNISPQALVDGVYDGENSTVIVHRLGMTSSGNLREGGDLDYIKIDLGQAKCVQGFRTFDDGKSLSLVFFVSVLNHNHPLDFVSSSSGNNLTKNNNQVSTFKHHQDGYSDYRAKSAMCGRYILVLAANNEMLLKEIEVHGWEA